jgi:arabinofuranosyltransferase
MAAWGGWFIFRSSFVVAGRRVFCLLDDPLVAMTYARNLVEGHGLNWARAGEPVEGFTQPLWTVLMVPIHALPLDPRTRSLLVQLLSLALLAANVVLVRRVTLRWFSTERARHWLPAAVLTAFYYPLDHHSLMGFESGLLALLTTALVLVALDVVRGGADRHRELLLLGAAACLVRMDMLPIVAAVQVYVIANGGWRERRQRIRWLEGAALFAVVAGAYLAFRRAYFGDLLPNAYYLYFHRIPLAVRLARGAVTLWASLSDHLLLLACVAAGLEVASRRGGPAGRDLARRSALPASLFLAGCAFHLFAGGDEQDVDLELRASRFVVFLMPQVFILCGGLINQAADWIVRRRPQDALAPRFFVAAATVFSLIVADGLWLARDDARNWMALIGGDPPRGVEAQAELYGSLEALRSELGPGAVVATGVAGVPAYFTGYRMVDLLGGNERHIARSAPAIPLQLGNFSDYVPGRAKWDLRYVLARYRPDAVLGWRGLGDASALLAAAGYRRAREGDVWLLAIRAAARRQDPARPGNARMAPPGVP